MQDTHPLQHEIWARIAIDKELGNDRSWASFEVPDDVPTWLDASDRGAYHGVVEVEFRGADLFSDEPVVEILDAVYRVDHPTAPLAVILALDPKHRFTNTDDFDLVLLDQLTGRAESISSGFLDESYMAFQAFERDFDGALSFFAWLKDAKEREEARKREEARLIAEAAVREAARIQEEKDRAEIEKELEAMADTFGAF